MSNRLKNQSSPYLLQHAENPVDWYPWCSEAFERAEREDKPVFLSIGYSTCHWCHVMAHESFEDEEIAEILNDFFISIKVDREERPDVDSVYMSVCQALTGSGGWPMSIFMTADQKPFFAGTYFPPFSRQNVTGFRELLLMIVEQWKENRSDLLKSADQILAYLSFEDDDQDKRINGNLLEMAADMLSREFDMRNGGFGSAPKFPMAHNLMFLTLYSQISQSEAAFEQVKMTLEKMRRGGIFDHIGYGFSRYSTDSYFLVPHFEKMLYDNALLIMAYAAAYKVSGERLFLDTAEKTAEYILREMTGPDGEFYSAQDADSEGEEGKFYVWTYDEICEVLGADRGAEFCEYFGVTRRGNFDGKNILNLLGGKDIFDGFEFERKRLYEYRGTRAELHLDDKILTSWNALMISAMSVLYRVTGNETYLSTAKRAQEYIEKKLAEEDILFVSCCKGVHSVKGFLDDYAYYAAALISLYEATCDDVYLDRAKQVCGEAERQFRDEKGGYFLCGAENSRLITTPKETYDGALPSGNSILAYCFVRIAQITDDDSYKQAAEKQLAFLSAESEHYPAGYCMFLIALLMYLNPPQKITAVLGEEDPKADILKGLPLYADIKILDQPTKEYRLLNGGTTYYICRDHVCLPPSNRI